MAARRGCGFTQDKLTELLEKADKGDVRFERYFFTTTPPRHLAHLQINDDLVRCINCGKTIAEHPLGYADAASHSAFLCHAVIPNCKKINGIRSLIYSTAQTHLARYRNASSPQDSIVYSDDDLKICVAFSTEASRGNFRNAILSLLKPPASLQGISCSIVTDSVLEIGDYIVETSSASNAFPRALAASSLLAMSSSNIKCWKTRIIQCLRNFFPERARIAPDGKRYRDGEAADNYLALYRVPMHQLFDGIDTEGNLPQVMLVPGAVASQDPTTLRYPVKIVVCCNSQSTYDALAQFMQIGAMHDVPNLRITCTVFVEHPDLFCANLQKRAGETRKAWCIEDSA